MIDTGFDLQFERRLNEVLLAAFDRPDGEREPFLERVCRHEPELLGAVQAILAREPTIDGFLVQPILAETLEEPSRPETVGPYRILETLGQGGMGTVYLAEQEAPIQRRVALKRLRRRARIRDDAELRFRAEAQALARMEHPNIARMIEVGETPEGVPYLVMEYAPGLPIHTFCDRHRFGLDQRLALFLEVCSGLQHAHQRGIIHRDIKPTNVLVTGDADRPVPKLIDFGIAKGFDEPLTEAPLVTGEQVIGTPAYLSPEVLDCQPADVRSDVYALGILLYQLLAGIKPLVGDKPTFMELLRRIREDEIPRASQAVADLGADGHEVAARRGLSAASLVRHLRQDLDWILLRATAKDPDQRYASVSELAADLERYRGHKTVHAGPPSWGYRMRKFVRRHRAAVAAGVLILLTLVGGLVGTTLEAGRANREAEASRQALDFMVDLFAVSAPRRSAGRLVTARELLELGAVKIRHELEDQPLNRARLLDAIGQANLGLGLIEDGESLIREGLALRRQGLPEDHPDIAVSLTNLGTTHRVRGKYAEAESILRQASALHEEAGAWLELANTLRELAVVLLMTGEREQALATAERSLSAGERVLAKDDPELVRFLELVAWSHSKLGQNEEAEAKFKRALEWRLSGLAPGHPDIAHSYSALGEFYAKVRRFDQAAAATEMAIAIAAEAYDEEHALLGAMMASLAGTKRALGQFEDAERLYRRSLPILEKSYGPEHPQVALTLNNLGALYWYQKDFARAEPHYRRSLELKEKSFGPQHPTVALSASNLGEVYWQLDRYEEAVPLLKRAIAIYRDVYEAVPGDLAYPLHALAVIRREQGVYDASEALFQEALELRHEHAAGTYELLETEREFDILKSLLGQEGA